MLWWRSEAKVVGPFNCTKSGSTNLPFTSKTWWCVGWVYKEKNVRDVLDTLGICGGLLGLISSVVPLVYYLSYYKKCACPLSVTWIVPCIPPSILGLVVWHTHPVGPSVLSIVTLSVFITMVFLGWSWAAWRSCHHESCLELCFQILTCFGKCYKILICGIRCSELRGCECCSLILTEKSKSYPWCCCTRESALNVHGCYKGCRRNPWCWNKWLDFCCENEVEKSGPNNQESVPSAVHTAIQFQLQPSTVHTAIRVQPQPSKKQLRPSTNRS